MEPWINSEYSDERHAIFHTKQKKWAHGSPSTRWLSEQKTSIHFDVWETSWWLLLPFPPFLLPSITSIPVVLIHPQVTFSTTSIPIVLIHPQVTLTLAIHHSFLHFHSTPRRTNKLWYGPCWKKREKMLSYSPISGNQEQVRPLLTLEQEYGVAIYVLCPLWNLSI